MKQCLIQSCKGKDNCLEHCPCDCHIPQEVKNRELFMKTCDLMFSHYRILDIVDLETAMKIIEGVLKK